MTKPIVAWLDMPASPIREMIEETYTLVPLKAGEPLPAQAADARALITTGSKGPDAALIAQLPALEIIASNSVGYDAIDVEAARARGIRVTNTPDVLTDDVADLAIALMIGAFRQLPAGERYVRAGDWAAGKPLPLARSASGRRLGIVGLGRIGKAIARRAEPMMASIAYTGRHAQEGVDYRYVGDVVTLARECDVLIVMVPATPETEGMIDRDVLDALGPEGVLVNVSRGSVVDEAALIAALQDGRLGGAALDVFVDEPNVPAALIAMDHVVLQPHRGSATVETRRAMGQLVVDNLAAHFAGRALPTPVV